MRKQLQELQEEFQAFKEKAKKEHDEMQSGLTEKHRREMEQLKEKYERMLDELRKNASSDKEFVQMEMQKRIKDLEQ